MFHSSVRGRDIGGEQFLRHALANHSLIPDSGMSLLRIDSFTRFQTSRSHASPLFDHNILFFTKCPLLDDSLVLPHHASKRPLVSLLTNRIEHKPHQAMAASLQSMRAQSMSNRAQTWVRVVSRRLHSSPPLNRGFPCPPRSPFDRLPMSPPLPCTRRVSCFRYPFVVNGIRRWQRRMWLRHRSQER